MYNNLPPGESVNQERIEMEPGKGSGGRSRSFSVVGVGDPGCGVANGLIKKGISGVETVAISDEPKHLLELKTDKKYFLNNGIPRGMGVCTDPIIGEEAARRDAEQIGELIRGRDVVFVVAGLGGRIGSGAMPVVAEMAKREASLVVSFVTFPFASEGKIRRDNAIGAIGKLKEFSDTTVIVPLEGVTETVPGLDLTQSFKVADEVLKEAISGLLCPLTKEGWKDFHYDDFRTVFGEGGMATIGIGESDSSGMKGLEEATEEAISSPLLVLDGSRADTAYVTSKNRLVKVHVPPSSMKAKAAFVSFSAGNDVPENEFVNAVEVVRKRIPENARIIWYSFSDQTLMDVKRCVVVLTGTELPLLFEQKPINTE